MTNRVGLSNQLDALGLPKPMITYAFDPYVLEGMREATAVASELFARAGSKTAPTWPRA